MWTLSYHIGWRNYVGTAALPGTSVNRKARPVATDIETFRYKNVHYILKSCLYSSTCLYTDSNVYHDWLIHYFGWCFRSFAEWLEMQILSVQISTLLAGYILTYSITYMSRKGKAVPVQAWRGREFFCRLRLPEFMTSLSVLHTGLVLISVRGWVDPKAIVQREWNVNKNCSDTTGEQTLDLPACSTVTHPTAPPRAPLTYQVWLLTF